MDLAGSPTAFLLVVPFVAFECLGTPPVVLSTTSYNVSALALGLPFSLGLGIIIHPAPELSADIPRTLSSACSVSVLAPSLAS